MIFKYRFGNPIPTDTVVKESEVREDAVPFVTVLEGESISYEMADADIVYGLGENVRGINKRGWTYCSKCSDQPHHQEDTHSLYGAHNFLVVSGKETFGLFLDYSGVVSFDVGYTTKNGLVITPADWNFDLYILTGESVPAIVKEFRGMVGRSYIAPKWAFGYGQSRWSYMTADEVRQVVKKHRENDLPLDSVYLDIDYMERYKDFTLNEEAFPNFEDFVRELSEENIHLVPIIDAGVKKEDGYSVYEEGMEKGYFCTKEDGSPFVAAVWPGHAMFTDFLNSEAREWFGNQYAFLLDKGIDGFWNDMNEPAIFYTEDRLKEAFEKLDGFKGKNLAMEDFWALLDVTGSLSGNEEDYKTFYHEMNGQRIRHDKVHNLYGYNMTRAAGEAFERLSPDKRILMFSRASCIGMHRYGGIWQGDNKSWWSHLLMNLQMSPALNMCGFLYTGADLGGFGSNTTEELLLRWLAFGIFSPLMRNHAARDTRRQEIYEFEDIPAFRSILKLRYRLLPYLYSEYMKAALDNEMYFMPLAFAYPEDPRAARVEDQLLVGESLMIAPVYQPNAGGRYVYLPESMRMFRLKRDGSLESSILEAGDHYVEIPADEMIFFLRKGHLLPMAEGGNSVPEVDFENLTVFAYPDDGEVSYEYYHDDGEGKDYDNPENRAVITVSGDVRGYEVTV